MSLNYEDILINSKVVTVRLKWSYNCCTSYWPKLTCNFKHLNFCQFCHLQYTYFGVENQWVDFGNITEIKEHSPKVYHIQKVSLKRGT